MFVHLCMDVLRREKWFIYHGTQFIYTPHDFRAKSFQSTYLHWRFGIECVEWKVSSQRSSTNKANQQRLDTLKVNSVSGH